MYALAEEAAGELLTLDEVAGVPESLRFRDVAPEDGGDLGAVGERAAGAGVAFGGVDGLPMPTPMTPCPSTPGRWQ